LRSASFYDILILTKKGGEMQNIVIKILIALLPMVSSQLKEYFPDILKSLEAKAKATSNPLDDIFVMVLKGLLQ